MYRDYVYIPGHGWRLVEDVPLLPEPIEVNDDEVEDDEVHADNPPCSM